MGLIGAGAPEYRMLAELGAPRFLPDLVLVNIFLGNDPPDLHRHVHDRSPAERMLRRSYVWTFFKNVRRARGGLLDGGLPARVPATATVGRVPRGGARVEGTSELAADDPALIGPVLSDVAYQEVLATDLGRFYRPKSTQDVRTAWASMLADLDALHRVVTRVGSRLALALFPSNLQVDASLRSATVARMGASLRYRGLSVAEIDPGLPNGLLAEYARSRGIPYVDLTSAFVNEYATGEPLYKQNDTHWTPRGNRVAAHRLAPFLASLVCSP